VAIIGVSKMPGAIVITLIFSGARSRAIGNVMPATPPFEAEYAAWPTCPSKAATDAVLMITPRSSPSGSVAAIRSAASRITLKVPTRLTLIARWKSANGNGPRLPTVLAALTMPAQLTATRRVPSDAARSSAADTDSGSVTSPAANRTPSPRPAAASSPAEVGRSNSTTRAPAARRARAVAKPSPDAPPVIKAT